MKEPFKVYVGVVATETTEGRGRTRPYGYYCTREDAIRAVKGKSAWGSDGYVREAWAITLEEEGEETTYLLGEVIDITVPEGDEEKKRALKARALKASALSKLSPEERAALGLK